MTIDYKPGTRVRINDNNCSVYSLSYCDKVLILPSMWIQAQKHDFVLTVSSCADGLVTFREISGGDPSATWPVSLITEIIDDEPSNSSGPIMGLGANHITFDDISTKHQQRRKTMTQKCNIMMKKLLSKDLRTLVEAGYINGDLELTDEGMANLRAILFEQNKEALVALAEEKLQEEKGKQ